MSKLIFQRCSLILNYNCLSYVNRQKKKKDHQNHVEIFRCDILWYGGPALCSLMQPYPVKTTDLDISSSYKSSHAQSVTMTSGEPCDPPRLRFPLWGISQPSHPAIYVFGRMMARQCGRYPQQLWWWCWRGGLLFCRRSGQLCGYCSYHWGAGHRCSL